MKKMIALVGTLLLSAHAFASVQPGNIDSALNSALRSQHSIAPSANTTIYGGKDVAPHVSLDAQSDA